MDKKTIVLSAGGTGGHLFPAEALAAELLDRGHRVIIFTDKRGMGFKSLGDRAEIHSVRAATLKPGIIRKIRAVIDMGIGILSAALKLRRIRPDVIVGFGGYPSFPAVFAGQRMGMTTILHEQNGVLGKANIWLANAADQIAVSLDNTKGISAKNAGKAITTGNPVRVAVIEAGATPYAPPTDDIRILITGGSQAASIFSDVVPDALGKLPDDIKKRLNIMHQCRENDIDITTRKYAACNVRAEIKPFFNNIAERLRDCHLFMGRSGASTVAEIAVAGRPAIFVPMRHADMQQKHNAEALTSHNGGWMIMQEDFTPDTLAARLESLLKNPSELDMAAKNAKALGKPDAARNLADVVEKRMAAPKL
jgi:UDP-N-acetylglucosamine--N-acetylmuramyl-(pentapeptide) pyrophosphoryl-undecaprenol N-acetylglucosamine transferase